VTEQGHECHEFAEVDGAENYYLTIVASLVCQLNASLEKVACRFRSEKGVLSPAVLSVLMRVRMLLWVLTIGVTPVVFFNNPQSFFDQHQISFQVCT
jgi:hypothetical protein